MRKWMSERLKRRKKADDSTSKDAANSPQPLQPRFYDNEPVAPDAPAEAAEVATRQPSPSEREPEPESVPVSAPVAASQEQEPAQGRAKDQTGQAPRPRTARRRRRRGGRGGSRARTAGSPPAPVVAAALAATEPSNADASAPQSEAIATRPVDASHQSLPAQTAPRPSKGTVVLAVGLPGSGKSSWFKRHNIHPLSSDLLRELLFDDAQEQRFQDLVFSNLRSMLKARLIARRPMNYVDATNLTPHDRHSWIKLAKDYGYDVQGLFFDVPLEVCIERHQRRGRVVPDDIMRKMAGKLKAPTFDEGFSKITVVRVKRKEAAAG